MTPLTEKRCRVCNCTFQAGPEQEPICDGCRCEGKGGKPEIWARVQDHDLEKWVNKETA